MKDGLDRTGKKKDKKRQKLHALECAGTPDALPGPAMFVYVFDRWLNDCTPLFLILHMYLIFAPDCLKIF